MNKKIILIFFVIITVIAGYRYFSAPKVPVYEFIDVKRSNIIQEVSVTGKVEPVSSVDLAFERSAKIYSASVSVGDMVAQGQIIATLYNGDLLAQIDQADAALKSQQAKLDSLIKGTRFEEMAVESAKVESAKASLADAKSNLVDKIQDSYTKADDSIRNNIDSFFSNPKSATPRLTFVVSDQPLRDVVESKRYVIEGNLKKWSSSLSGLSSESDLGVYSKEASVNLEIIKDFLDKLSILVNQLTPTSDLTQTSIDTYKSNTYSSRTAINTSTSNLTAAGEKLSNAISALDLAEKNYDLKNAGATSEEVNSQRALTDEAAANLKNAKAQYVKTILRSPINGVVTKMTAKTGEMATANAVIASVISDGDFQMTANIPEADIAKVKIGDTARVTLDAYGSDMFFDASVSKIDPSETILEGVATYKTTFVFLKKDERVRSGMTANIDVLTDKKENVLTVPQRAVVSKGQEKSVLIDVGNLNPEERKIETGLRGTDGLIEIISGLKEGDKIVGTRE